MSINLILKYNLCKKWYSEVNGLRYIVALQITIHPKLNLPKLSSVDDIAYKLCIRYQRRYFS